MAGDKKELYEALGVEKTASHAEIKRAYRLMALKLHPDKNASDPDAGKKFQALQDVYAILGDEDKRKTYDETGFTGDNDFLGDADGLAGFGKVSEEDIASFEQSYRGGSEETKDLKDLYTSHRGNMKSVFEWLICSRVDEDSYRFMQILNAAIKDGELRSFPAYDKWAKAVARKGPPSNAIASAKKRKEAESSMALVAAIQKRSAGAGASFLDQLEAKYVTKAPAARAGRKRKE